MNTARQLADAFDSKIQVVRTALSAKPITPAAIPALVAIVWIASILGVYVLAALVKEPLQYYTATQSVNVLSAISAGTLILGIVMQTELGIMLAAYCAAWTILFDILAIVDATAHMRGQCAELHSDSLRLSTVAAMFDGTPGSGSIGVIPTTFFGDPCAGARTGDTVWLHVHIGILVVHSLMVLLCAIATLVISAYEYIFAIRPREHAKHECILHATASTMSTSQHHSTVIETALAPYLEAALLRTAAVVTPDEPEIVQAETLRPGLTKRTITTTSTPSNSKPT